MNFHYKWMKLPLDNEALPPVFEMFVWNEKVMRRFFFKITDYKYEGLVSI